MGATYGGSVSGLIGSGLVLENNGGNDLVVASDGPFVFSSAIASGSTYAVTAKTQPTSPSQTCVVSAGTGTISANASNVMVTCTTRQFTVGGSLSGLIGSGLVLQDNGGNDLAVTSNGSFVFSTAVLSGSAYAVTIKTQPTNPSQTCVLASGLAFDLDKEMPERVIEPLDVRQRAHGDHRATGASDASMQY